MAKQFFILFKNLGENQILKQGLAPPLSGQSADCVYLYFLIPKGFSEVSSSPQDLINFDFRKWCYLNNF